MNGRTAAEAYVALGANLGDPVAQLRAAVAALAELAPVTARSRIYASAAVGGPPGQPDYRNAVVALGASSWLGDEAGLLGALLEVEARLGRVRRERWGPRVLDLDLLDVAGQVRLPRAPGAKDLVLPHPRLEERTFVLAPLLDVAPEWRHPLTGRRAADALARLAPTARPTAEAW